MRRFSLDLLHNFTRVRVTESKERDGSRVLLLWGSVSFQHDIAEAKLRGVTVGTRPLALDLEHEAF